MHIPDDVAQTMRDLARSVMGDPFCSDRTHLLARDVLLWFQAEDERRVELYRVLREFEIEALRKVR